MIPCKECLVLARCKQKKTMECHKLYEWVKVNKRTAKDKLGDLSMDVELIYNTSIISIYTTEDIKKAKVIVRGEYPYDSYVELPVLTTE